MYYSCVVNSDLIQPKRKMYTMRDVNRLKGTIFKGSPLDMEGLIFVVKCSAVFHGTDYSNSLNDRLNKLRSVSKMF